MVPHGAVVCPTKTSTCCLSSISITLEVASAEPASIIFSKDTADSNDPMLTRSMVSRLACVLSEVYGQTRGPQALRLKAGGTRSSAQRKRPPSTAELLSTTGGDVLHAGACVRL